MVGIDELGGLRQQAIPRDTVLTSLAADTTYEIRFRSRGSSSRLALAKDAPPVRGFQSRALLRFEDLPRDTVTISEARLLLRPTHRLGEAVRLQVHRVTQSWVEREATWDEAQSGVPWGAPGGSFDPTPVGDTLFAGSTQDTIRIPLDLPTVQGWATGTLENQGMILLNGTPGTFLEIGSQVVTDLAPRLELNLRREGQADTLITLFPQEDTFIHTIDLEPPTGSLRVGALPGHRTYLKFDLSFLPQGTVINRAQVQLPVRDASRSLDLLVVSLHNVESAFIGPKTFFDPSPQSADTVSVADSLVVLDLTTLAQVWVLNPTLNRGLGLRSLQENNTLGVVDFWAPGAGGEPVPRLRLTFTPPFPPPVPQ